MKTGVVFFFEQCFQELLETYDSKSEMLCVSSGKTGRCERFSVCIYGLMKGNQWSIISHFQGPLSGGVH